MDKDTRSQIISDFALSEGDTGSSPVQVAILSARIKELTEHLKIHKKDHHTRRGLIRMVNRRRKHLNYLKRKDPAKWQDLCTQFGIRN